ncbi:MAG: FHA domain-containing protein [Bacteroidales bacterium]|nr:FHA domain-containing protein [Bacteroidales bacterium]
MKTITIGKLNCDIVIQDSYISRKHAEISLVDGQYVYRDLSKNGTTINGRVYHNEKIVIAPGTPVYLANKVPLPWHQVLMLLPNVSGGMVGSEKAIQDVSYKDSISVGWGIISFLFPIVGFILYFVWRDTEHSKAKQAANIAWISIGISFAIGFISGLAASF